MESNIRVTATGVLEMAKANQKFRKGTAHLLDFDGCIYIPSSTLTKLKNSQKARKRALKRKINKHRYKPPRGFKMAKKERYDPDKLKKQIDRGFEIAKRWNDDNTD